MTDAELLPPDGAEDGSIWWIAHRPGLIAKTPYRWSNADKTWNVERGWVTAKGAAFMGWTIHAPARPDDATERVRLEVEVARLRQALAEAEVQIEYLHGKFQETGSGNAVLARIREALRHD